LTACGRLYQLPPRPHPPVAGAVQLRMKKPVAVRST
jgi:hypothetical protein